MSNTKYWVLCERTEVFGNLYQYRNMWFYLDKFCHCHCQRKVDTNFRKNYSLMQDLFAFFSDCKYEQLVSHMCFCLSLFVFLKNGDSLFRFMIVSMRKCRICLKLIQIIKNVGEYFNSEVCWTKYIRFWFFIVQFLIIHIYELTRMCRY